MAQKELSEVLGAVSSAPLELSLEGNFRDTLNTPNIGQTNDIFLNHMHWKRVSGLEPTPMYTSTIIDCT